MEDFDINDSISVKKPNPEVLRDTIENLSLYLNEIEQIINAPSHKYSEDERKYKLQMLEQRIADMHELFRFISSEQPDERITLL